MASRCGAIIEVVAAVETGAAGKREGKLWQAQLLRGVQ